MDTSKSTVQVEKKMNLTSLLHLALNSTPKANLGIVNFDILKTFLLELLKASNLQTFEIQLGDDEKTTNIIESALQTNDKHSSYAHLINKVENFNGYSEDDKSTEVNNKTNKPSNISIFTGDIKPISFERIQIIENKLERIDQQIASLDSIPSNQQIIGKAKDFKKLGGSGPIIEIWQYTQLSKRMESNEEGLTKMSSLLQDILAEINEQKEAQSEMNKSVLELKEKQKNLEDRLASFEKFQKNMLSLDQLKNLENDLDLLRNQMIGKFGEFDKLFNRIEDDLKDIRDKINEMVQKSELEAYVKWETLENALKGIRDQIDSINFKVDEHESLDDEIRNTLTNDNKNLFKENKDKETENERTQTTPSLNKNSQPNSRPNSSLHPSFELSDILLKLGTLNQRHENLKDEVDKLKKESEKPKGFEPTVVQSGADLEKIFHDIKNMKKAIEELKHNLELETSNKKKYESILNDLNNNFENLKKMLHDCLKSTKLNQEEIENLKKAIEHLEQIKGDKEWILVELDKKADKGDVEKRVLKKTFDDNCDVVFNSLSNTNQKHATLEGELKKNSESLLKELETKLDRAEIDSLKDYLDKQLKKIKKIQRENIQSNNQQVFSEDDAAGLRKQLLRFHCISCDRPIDLTTGQSIVPSLPSERGLRPVQSARPYTTYELDQIRQFQRQQLFQEQNFDVFATIRQCGGPHTLVNLPKKSVKIPQSISEEVITPINQNEVQLQGHDGHIYKGRIDAKLSVDMNKKINRQNVINNRQVRNESNETHDDTGKISVFTNQSND